MKNVIQIAKVAVLSIALIGGSGLFNLLPAAHAATGWIQGSPNPCTASTGQNCTSYITWNTDAPHAVVYVSANGQGQGTPFSGDQTSCDGQNCAASWISPGTTYTFTLYELDPNTN